MRLTYPMKRPANRRVSSFAGFGDQSVALVGAAALVGLAALVGVAPLAGAMAWVAALVATAPLVDTLATGSVAGTRDGGGRQGWLAPMVLRDWQGAGAPMTMGSPRNLGPLSST